MHWGSHARGVPVALRVGAAGQRPFEPGECMYAGEGVGQLEEFSAQAAEETTEVPTPAPPTPAEAPETAQTRSSFEDSQGWIGWVVAGLVALLVIAVATFSLLRREP